MLMRTVSDLKIQVTDLKVELSQQSSQALNYASYVSESPLVKLRRNLSAKSPIDAMNLNNIYEKGNRVMSGTHKQ